MQMIHNTQSSLEVKGLGSSVTDRRLRPQPALVCAGYVSVRSIIPTNDES